MLRVFGRTVAGLTIFCAGCAFAWSGIATKLAANDFKLGHVLIAPALGARARRSPRASGTLSEMSSLQSRPAIQVAPVVFVTQTVIPVIVAPLLFGEHFDATPLDGWPLVASLALLVAGAAALARSPLLLAMMDPQRDQRRRAARTASPSRARARRRSVRARAPTRPSRRARRRARRRRGSGAEAAARRAEPQRALDRRRAVGAGQHELTDRQAAGRLQVVEAVVQAERVRLRVQHARAS